MYTCLLYFETRAISGESLPKLLGIKSSGKMKFLVALICVFHICYGAQPQKHGIDPGVCTTPVSKFQQKQWPTIPVQFQTHVEVSVEGKGKTTDIHEFYDGINNKARITQYDLNMTTYLYYDYNVRQLITYYPLDNTCIVTDLATDVNSDIFGTYTGGHVYMFSAAASLHFGGQGVSEIYMGPTTSDDRGLPVDQWESCQYWNDMDATSHVTWFFSQPGNWTSARDAQVPVNAIAKGRLYTTSTKFREFENHYSFFEFKTLDMDPTIFETPPGSSCPGRKDYRKMPVMPNGFSMNVESINEMTGVISSMEEYYDFDVGLVRYMYTPITMNPPFGNTPLMEVHDFNTGIAYVTDVKKGNCTAVPIEHSTFDVRTVDPAHVRMRTAKEFFYFDKANYTYEGVKTTRHIQADVWSGIRNDFPSRANPTVWEWYFATNGWHDVDWNIRNIPLQMRVTYTQFKSSIQYNIYDYRPYKPDLSKFDISACFINTPRRMFQFTLPGQYKATADTNLTTFQSAILKTISRVTQLRPIRISGLRVIFDKDIVITFQMLDVSPIVGDITNKKWEVPLSAAGDAFMQSVKRNAFVVQLDSTFTVSMIVAMPNSAIEVVYKAGKIQQKVQATTGYGPGPMAAVGITMPIVGFGLGAMVAFFFFK
ncbi:hypothetical protein ScPMuIL_002913 [Solemya velum]